MIFPVFVFNISILISSPIINGILTVLSSSIGKNNLSLNTLFESFKLKVNLFISSFSLFSPIL